MTFKTIVLDLPLFSMNIKRLKMKTFGAVLPAGGLGTRMGSDKPKQLIELKNKSVLVYAVEAFLEHPQVLEIVVACPKDWEDYFRKLLEPMGVKVVLGGDDRWQSVRNGVLGLSENIDGVLAHDVARPLVSQKIISDCISTLVKKGGCLVAKPVVDTVQMVEDGQLKETIDRNKVWLAQTPQCFSKKDLIEVYNNMPQNYAPTDEAGLMRKMGFPVYVVEGEERNNKLTKPQDLEQFEYWVDQKDSHEN
jgi:2-C-methyl-D-erythritol 4-phosphate cytidylyltransferase